jgi:hypothetical protein
MTNTSGSTFQQHPEQQWTCQSLSHTVHQRQVHAGCLVETCLAVAQVSSHPPGPLLPHGRCEVPDLLQLTGIQAPYVPEELGHPPPDAVSGSAPPQLDAPGKAPASSCLPADRSQSPHHFRTTPGGRLAPQDHAMETAYPAPQPTSPDEEATKVWIRAAISGVFSRDCATASTSFSAASSSSGALRA